MFARLSRNEDGAAVVEFGLLIPVILGSFLAVLQAGIGMMAYNSLRNLVAETSRYTLVEYQSSNELTVEEIELDGKARAPSHGFAPAKFVIDVDQPEVQRIEGAIELTITTKYQVASVLPFLGINAFDVTFSRPIFLIDEVDSSEEGSELDETAEDPGTDFGEGGIVDGEEGGTEGESQCADSGSCDHEHESD